MSSWLSLHKNDTHPKTCFKFTDNIKLSFHNSKVMLSKPICAKTTGIQHIPR